MMTRPLICLGFSVLLAVPAGGDERKLTPQQIEFFESKVRPQLITHCYACHSAEAKKLKGGLHLDSREGLMAGGDSGPAVVPGKPNESRLIKAIRYDNEELRMPPKGKLPANIIADLEKWVEMGAPDPRDKASAAATAKPKEAVIDIEQGRRFWAFQPPQRLPAPNPKDPSWARNDIDRFILAKLEEKGLRPARDADRYTLLRRVAIDLTGLPPTPEEMQAFVGDKSPDAYEKVVDRLLASPVLGERWGRHWLDLTCFADLQDVDGNIIVRDAWRYRDYVIDAFNKDKPFDQFIHEQLAGDLMPPPLSPPSQGGDEERREQIIATGFLAIGPWALQNYIKGQMLADDVDHQIDKIGKIFLGLSLGCCRCHDHKFDAIPTKDYYALAGIFHSTVTTQAKGPGVWSTIVQTPLPELPAEFEQRKKTLEQYETAMAAFEKEQKELTSNQKRLADALAALSKKSTAAAEKPTSQVIAGADSKETQKADASAEKKVADDAAEKKRLEKEQNQNNSKLHALNEKLRFTKYNRPNPPEALTVRDAEKPGDSRIYTRGDFRNLGEAVPRGFLQVATPGAMPKIPTGRSGRLELAQWLTSGDNPLTARVTVNRLWHHLFGAGLVRSVDYFGTRGERPSHPELLDHLAVRFASAPDPARNGGFGWSVKAMIRYIVTSRTYQMASDHDKSNWEKDPDNRLLWRTNRRRLEAEAIRDTILAVSGRLDAGRGGPSLGIEIPGNVAGAGDAVNLPSHTGKKIPDSVINRRTVYLPLFRKRPDSELEILSVFDFPHPSEIVGARARTTVPTQALFLMNSPFLREQSQHAARRLLARKDLDDVRRLGWLCELALNRPIREDEERQWLQFLKDNAWESLSESKPPANARQEAWAQLCHAMLASNEFLFRR